MISSESPQPQVHAPSENRDIVGLARIACYAATELDRLRVNASTPLAYVVRLREVISAEMGTPGESTFDPATITVFSWALTDSKLFQPSPTATIDDLLAEAKKVMEDLEAVTSEPANYRETHPQQLEVLRDVCLSLSRQASAYEFSSGLEEPELPERALYA
jgi:hypothetical protein